MTDPSVPPPLPGTSTGPTRGERLRRLLSWFFILAACAWIASSGVVERADPEVSDRTTTTVLSLQCRLLLSFAQTQPDRALDQFRPLERTISGPSGARALASVYAFLPGEEARLAAFGLLEKHVPEPADKAGVALHATVRQAIDDPASLTPSDTEEIRTKLGWFGDVLLAAPLDPQDPERASFYQKSQILASLMVAFALGALFACAAGLALFIVAVVRFQSGKFVTRFRPEPRADTVYLEAFAIFLVVMSAAQVALYLGTSGAEPALPLQLGGMFLPCLVGVLWPALRGQGFRNTFRALGFHRGRGIFREIGCGLAGYIAILPLVAVGFVLVILLSVIRQGVQNLFAHWRQDATPAPEIPMSHPVLDWIAEGNILTILEVYFLAAVFAPLFEELLFRGAFFRGLRARNRLIASGLLTGFVFAVIHPQGIIAVPALMSLGFGFALLREWRDSVIAPMTGHALHNATLVTLMCIAFSA